MNIEAQDRELTLKMRKIIAFAKETLPNSIVCVFSFTHAEDGSSISLNKIATNAQDREELGVQVVTVMTAFMDAGVIDLTDTNGTMQ